MYQGLRLFLFPQVQLRLDVAGDIYAEAMSGLVWGRASNVMAKSNGWRGERKVPSIRARTRFRSRRRTPSATTRSAIYGNVGCGYHVYVWPNMHGGRPEAGTERVRR